MRAHSRRPQRGRSGDARRNTPGPERGRAAADPSDGAPRRARRGAVEAHLAPPSAGRGRRAPPRGSRRVPLEPEWRKGATSGFAFPGRGFRARRRGRARLLREAPGIAKPTGDHRAGDDAALALGTPLSSETAQAGDEFTAASPLPSGIQPFGTASGHVSHAAGTGSVRLVRCLGSTRCLFPRRPSGAPGEPISFGS
jgi:hypothetical protein